MDVFFRGHTGLFFEQPAEIMDGGEAKFFGDLGDGELLQPQEPLGVPDAKAVDMVQHGVTVGFLEAAAKGSFVGAEDKT